MEQSPPLPKLLLLTTVSSIDRMPLLDRLINSIASEAANSTEIDHRILLQDGIRHGVSATPGSYRITFSRTPERLSLSAARNVLLTSLAGEPLQGTVLAFPDDDAWYPPGLIEHVLGRFAHDTDLDLWICRYGSVPVAPQVRLAASPSFSQMLRHASSNTIFLRADVMERITGFSEELGLGTCIPGGEDTEFAIRAFARARASELMPLSCVGHRDPDPTIRARYYIGGLAALAHNLHDVRACRPALRRKLLVGVYHFLTARLKLADLLRAWRHAAAVALRPRGLKDGSNGNPSCAAKRLGDRPMR
jgi:hypothetical protein